MAAAYGFLGRPLDKVHACQMAIATNPNSATAHANLGSALGKLGRFDVAAAALREAVRLAPDIPGFRFALGLAYVSLGDLPAARSQQQLLEQLDRDEALQLRQLIDAAGAVEQRDA